MARPVVFTDLDGTLLNPLTASFDAALPALGLLEVLGVPVVICTSKTCAETLEVRERLGNRHPFVVENGGAALFPEGYFDFARNPDAAIGVYRRISFGRPYSELTAGLRRASFVSGCPVRAFHAMTAEEIAALCGLSRTGAEMAKRREYDEPFQILEPRRKRALFRSIESLGMRWTNGDNWSHITGQNDKGTAVAALLEMFRSAGEPVISIGLGDSANDAPFLEMMDIARVIRSRSTAVMRRLASRASFTKRTGAAGWNEAVLELPWREWTCY